MGGGYTLPLKELFNGCVGARGSWRHMVRRGTTELAVGEAGSTLSPTVRSIVTSASRTSGAISSAGAVGSIRATYAQTVHA